MKKFLFLFAATSMVLGFTSCDEEESITPKDYGTYTFAADMAYDSDSESETYKVYTQQTYFAFGEDDAISTGTYAESSWVDFDLVEGTGVAATTVEGWDLVFTKYVANLGTADEPYSYSVCGVLSSSDLTVAEYEYTDSEDSETISEAFANLTTADITDFEFLSDADVIGYNWKSYDSSAKTYTVSTNMFYIVKTASDEYYKVRFISFYGESTSERIITMEYALMQ